MTTTTDTTVTKPAKTPKPAPTYTHIVNTADKLVSHNFSMSGWENSKRHAATYNRMTGCFDTLCKRSMHIDTEYDDGRVRTEGLEIDCKRLTCNACRKRLALPTLQKPRW